ncbi:SIMPL domain-containing protein [Tunturiibacter lichenicola]|uniref:SIMPL domain-containing protein n=1 Tax=Tunturiibacter lichenicola TaxID=2051959 RepID=UPI0021B254CF|nr:SIMPL domain-containing protein [Edaphobacter lichenicola]
MNVHRLARLALCATLFAMNAAAQTIQISKENRTIAITATDKVMVLADTATVHIGFIAYGPDSDTAYAAGSRVSNAIVKALTTAGVASDAIESENQNVSPVQEFQIDKLTPAEKAQRKFQVTQSWTVRTNADDAAKTLDLAVKAGANQSGQIDWSMNDENAAQAEAAAKALQRARSVAGQMAKGLDVKLGALIYASNETQAEPPRPLMRAMAAAPMAQKVAPLAINPRQIEKTATVYAVFAIE